jgi:hypothetical protein
MAEQSTVLTVGDHVRLISREKNRYPLPTTYTPGQAPSHEPVDGLVLAIREIATGKLTTQAGGALDGFVVELLYDSTFNTKWASLKNAPRTADRPNSTPSWKRIRALLRDAAEKGQLWSTASPDLFTASPMAKLLDGWKVVKIVAAHLEALDTPEPGPATE